MKVGRPNPDVKGPLPSDMVSLAERLYHMLAVRATFVVVTLSAGLLGVKVVGVAYRQVLVLSALYVALAVAIEGLRRSSRRRGLVLISVMLLVDGLYLAWCMYASGGARSPLSFLLYLHLIAVTLLASYRTGLKIALWHSLLLFVGFYAQLAGYLDPVGGSDSSPEQIASEFRNISIYYVIAFWAVALATVAFSSLNERELRRRGVDLEALASMAAQLDDVAESASAAEKLVECSSSAFEFPRAAVLIHRSGAVRVLAHKGAADIPNIGDSGVDRLIQDAWAGRRCLVVTRVDTRSNSNIAALFPGAKRVVIVPMMVEDERIGALVAEESPRRRYRIDSRVRPMVEQFASHAALVVSNVRLLEQVRTMAETDPLTNIPNRLMFDRILRRETKRADRTGESLGLLLLDIDHFKNLNDTLGHQAGDDALRVLALVLSQHCRAFDTVARYGGEEFAVIVPAAEMSECLEVAERLRAQVAGALTPAPLTVSVGVAVHEINDDPKALVKAADEALYISKRRGRDRVTAASPGLYEDSLVGSVGA
jgi:diguanylate cyclase (GGDEF)-like protein